MNEFEGRSKEHLKYMRLGIESYIQGVKDTWKILEEIFNETIKVYETKLKSCNRELEKYDTK